MTLNLDPMRSRAKAAAEWVQRDPCNADGFLPLSFRTHFNHDVPALFEEVERLRSPEPVPMWLADLIRAAAQAAEELSCTEPALHDHLSDACAWEALYQAVPPRTRIAAEHTARKGATR